MNVCVFLHSLVGKMTGSSANVLALKEEDVTKLLISNCHQGSTNVDYRMTQYIFRRRKSDGVLIVYIYVSISTELLCFL